MLGGFQLSSCVPSPSLSVWLPGSSCRALPQARLLASDGVQTVGGSGNSTERAGTLRTLRHPLGRPLQGKPQSPPPLDSSGLGWITAPSGAGPGVPQGPLWVSLITRPPLQ